MNAHDLLFGLLEALAGIRVLLVLVALFCLLLHVVWP